MRKSDAVKFGCFDTDFKIAADFDLIAQFYVAGIEKDYIDIDVCRFSDLGVSNRNRVLNDRESSLIIRKRFGTVHAFLFALKKKIRRLLSV
jgi:hypothetical protein